MQSYKLTTYYFLTNYEYNLRISLEKNFHFISTLTKKNGKPINHNSKSKPSDINVKHLTWAVVQNQEMGLVFSVSMMIWKPQSVTGIWHSPPCSLPSTFLKPRHHMMKFFSSHYYSLLSDPWVLINNQNCILDQITIDSVKIIKLWQNNNKIIINELHWILESKIKKIVASSISIRHPSPYDNHSQSLSLSHELLENKKSSKAKSKKQQHQWMNKSSVQRNYHRFKAKKGKK